MSSSRTRRLLLALAGTAVLAGCGGAPAHSPGATARPAASTTLDTGTSASATASPSGPGEETATTPPPETSGAESTASRQPSQPSVEVASLPIGGGTDDDDPAVDQCIDVSYLGSEPIPAGVRIAVTGVSFDPPSFRLGGGGCSGRGTPCTANGFAFTETNENSDDGRCVVEIHATGPTPADGGNLVLKGQLLCPAGQEAPCQRFANAVRAAQRENPQTIRVDAPDLGQSSSPSSATSSASVSSAPPPSSTPSSSSSGG